MSNTVWQFEKINGEVVFFENGIGYIESDKGTSFRKSYIWTQCSIPKEQPSSIVAAVADIPLWDLFILMVVFAAFITAADSTGCPHIPVLRWYTVQKTNLYWCRKIFIKRLGLLKGNPLPLKAPQKGAMDRNDS